MKRPQPAETIANPMNHDVSAGPVTTFCSRRRIRCTRIRDVKRELKGTIPLVRVDYVSAFRCSMISFTLFCALGRATERHRVALERGFAAKERELTRGFFCDSAVRPSVRCKRVRLVARSAECNADDYG